MSSLLEGLAEQLGAGSYDPTLESEMDSELEFDPALEAAYDEIKKLEGQGELSSKDVAAILDDNNPDNIAADIQVGEENPENIGEGDGGNAGSLDDELATLESMLDEMAGDPEDVSSPDETVPAAMDEAEECGDGECSLGKVEESTAQESAISASDIFKLMI